MRKRFSLKSCARQCMLSYLVNDSNLKYLVNLMLQKNYFSQLSCFPWRTRNASLLCVVVQISGLTTYLSLILRLYIDVSNEWHNSKTFMLQKTQEQTQYVMCLLLLASHYWRKQNLFYLIVISSYLYEMKHVDQYRWNMS